VIDACKYFTIKGPVVNVKLNKLICATDKKTLAIKRFYQSLNPMGASSILSRHLNNSIAALYYHSRLEKLFNSFQAWLTKKNVLFKQLCFRFDLHFV